MNKKAQNIIEILLLACFVAILSFTVFLIYNKSNLNLTDLSKTKVKQQATVDLGNMSPAQADDIVPYTPIETIGSVALICMTLDEFNNKLLNITYAQINNAFNPSGGGPNLADLANALISSLGLDITPLNPNYVTPTTLNTLVEIFQIVSGSAYSGNPDAQEFTFAFGALSGHTSCTPH